MHTIYARHEVEWDGLCSMDPILEKREHYNNKSDQSEKAFYLCLSSHVGLTQY